MGFGIAQVEHPRSARGFTLLEVIVAIGILTLLLALLLPAISRVRGESRAILCLNNIRQVGCAVLLYSSGSKGAMPQNIDSPAPGQHWLDADRVGPYLAMAQPGDLSPTICVCPNDDGARLSYAMNVWASSKIDTSKLLKGSLWMANATDSSVILIAEAWSQKGPATIGWTPLPTIGFAGSNDGQRFGAGGGLSPTISAGRFGQVNSELPYIRHRSPSQSGLGTKPIGRVTIFFGDGHAELLSNTDLANPITGVSTGKAAWTPDALQ